MSERKLSEPAMHAYEVRPRSDKRGVDLISDALPFGRPSCADPDAISDAIDYAKSGNRIVPRPRGRDHSLAIKVAGQRKVAPLITKGGLKSDRHNLSIGLKRGPVGSAIQIAK